MNSKVRFDYGLSGSRKMSLAQVVSLLELKGNLIKLSKNDPHNQWVARQYIDMAGYLTKSKGYSSANK